MMMLTMMSYKKNARAILEKQAARDDQQHELDMQLPLMTYGHWV